MSTSSHPIRAVIAFFWANPILAAFLMSASLLLGAYGFQYLGGLEPCDLCWTQRYAHFVIIALSGLGLILQKWGKGVTLFFSTACVLGFGASAGIAGYHAGVEQKWWQGPATCTAGGQSNAVDMDSLFDNMMEAKLVLCDEIPWELFGISMASYNFLISFMMCLWLFCAVKAKVKG